jgi:hypothetical protein
LFTGVPGPGFQKKVLRVPLNWLPLSRSLLDLLFEKITDEDTDDEDDHENDDLDEYAQCTDETNKEPPDKERNNTKYYRENDSDEQPLLEEVHLILFTAAEIPECKTNNEDQQFKPHTLSSCMNVLSLSGFYISSSCTRVKNQIKGNPGITGQFPDSEVYWRIVPVRLDRGDTWFSLVYHFVP